MFDGTADAPGANDKLPRANGLGLSDSGPDVVLPMYRKPEEYTMALITGATEIALVVCVLPGTTIVDG